MKLGVKMPQILAKPSGAVAKPAVAAKPPTDNKIMQAAIDSVPTDVGSRLKMLM